MVVVVVGVVDPGMVGGGTCHRPRCFLLRLWFPHMRSGRLLLNLFFMPTGEHVFSQLGSYFPTDYCPSNRVRLLPRRCEPLN